MTGPTSRIPDDRTVRTTGRPRRAYRELKEPEFREPAYTQRQYGQQPPLYGSEYGEAGAYEPGYVDGALPFPPEAPDREPRRRRAPSGNGGLGVLVAMAVGSLVAVGLGAYGRMHEPTGIAISIAGFSSGLAAKSWLASLAFLLALVQLWSAAAMYGKLGGRWRRLGPPRWVATVHRWSGRLAVLVTVPVVVHCLYALGYDDSTLRVMVHSLAGCFLYGVFVTKMLVLQQPRSPGWSLPLFGGLLFTALTAVWASSAAWFFSTSGLTF